MARSSAALPYAAPSSWRSPASTGEALPRIIGARNAALLSRGDSISIDSWY
jgi:hypothetical protein